MEYLGRSGGIGDLEIDVITIHPLLFAVSQLSRGGLKLESTFNGSFEEI